MVLRSRQVIEWFEQLDGATREEFKSIVRYLVEHKRQAGGGDVKHGIAQSARYGKDMGEIRLRGREGQLYRALFVFHGPDEVIVLLVAGDKSGKARTWYDEAVAEATYEDFLRATEGEGPP